MYEFHYHYMVPKYGENLTLCYMDTDSLVYRIKTEDFYADIVDDVPTRFDTSGYCLNRPLPVGMNKKLYSFRKLDGAEDKKCKGIKKCVIKKTLDLTFEDYKTCLFNPDAIHRLQLMFRSSKHEVHTVEVNKVTLN